MTIVGIYWDGWGPLIDGHPQGVTPEPHAVPLTGHGGAMRYPTMQECETKDHETSYGGVPTIP